MLKLLAVFSLSILASPTLAANDGFTFHYVSSDLDPLDYSCKLQYREALKLEFKRIIGKLKMNNVVAMKGNIEIAKAEMATPILPAYVEVYKENVDPRPLSRNVGENGVVLTTTFEMNDSGGCLAKQLLYRYEKKDETPEVKKIFEGQMDTCNLYAIADDAEDYRTEILSSSRSRSGSQSKRKRKSFKEGRAEYLRDKICKFVHGEGLSAFQPDKHYIYWRYYPEWLWPTALKQETHHAVLLRGTEPTKNSSSLKNVMRTPALTKLYNDLSADLRYYNPLFLKLNIEKVKNLVNDHHDDVEATDWHIDPLRRARKESAVVLQTSFYGPEYHDQKPYPTGCRVVQQLLLYRDSHSPEKQTVLINRYMVPCYRGDITLDLTRQRKEPDEAEKITLSSGGWPTELHHYMTSVREELRYESLEKYQDALTSEFAGIADRAKMTGDGQPEEIIAYNGRVARMQMQVEQAGGSMPLQAIYDSEIEASPQRRGHRKKTGVVLQTSFYSPESAKGKGVNKGGCRVVQKLYLFNKTEKPARTTKNTDKPVEKENAAKVVEDKPLKVVASGFKLPEGRITVSNKFHKPDDVFKLLKGVIENCDPSEMISGLKEAALARSILRTEKAAKVLSDEWVPGSSESCEESTKSRSNSKDGLSSRSRKNSTGSIEKWSQWDNHY